MASKVRASAFLSECLSLAKTCSMGFRSGEYFGKKNSLAPAERISWRAALPLWLPRLSMMTISPGRRVGKEDLLEVEAEALAVDRALEQPWRRDPIVTQRRQESHGLPAAVRNPANEPLATWRPTPQRRHIGSGPSLVDEDKPLRINAFLMLYPLRPPARDVATIPFASHHAFF